jgi:hypothetical protein
MEVSNLLVWVNGVLRETWDPIGLGTEGPQDEYGSYAPKVLRIVTESRDFERISRHLYKLETTSMGLRGDPNRCRRAAAVLIAPFTREGDGIDLVYLSKVEQLAHAVVEAACEEESFEVFLDDGDKTPLQRSISQLAREVRIVHWEGDGCFDHD